VGAIPWGPYSNYSGISELMQVGVQLSLGCVEVDKLGGPYSNYRVARGVGSGGGGGNTLGALQQLQRHQ
jgi:hypothetical protein